MDSKWKLARNIVIGLCIAAALVVGVIALVKNVEQDRHHYRSLRLKAHYANIEACNKGGGIVILNDELWFKSCVGVAVKQPNG